MRVGGPVAGDGVREVVGGRPLGARPPAHGALDAVPHPQHALGPPRQLEPRHGQQRPALAARLPHDRPADRQRVRRGQPPPARSPAVGAARRPSSPRPRPSRARRPPPGPPPARAPAPRRHPRASRGRSRGAACRSRRSRAGRRPPRGTRARPTRRAGAATRTRTRGSRAAGRRAARRPHSATCSRMPLADTARWVHGPGYRTDSGDGGRTLSGAGCARSARRARPGGPGG